MDLEPTFSQKLVHAPRLGVLAGRGFDTLLL